MKIVFKNKHLSIDRFESVDVPEFVVLTGVNGSGKSHLLEALLNRNVTIEGAEGARIILFNYETFRLENEGEFNGHQIAADKQNAWTFYEQHIRPHAKGWRAGLDAQYEKLKNDCVDQDCSFFNLDVGDINQYKTNFSNFFLSTHSVKDNPQALGIKSLALKLPYALDEIERDDFIRLYKPFAFKNNFLPQQIGKIFWDYYIKYRNNQINAFENAKNGKSYAELTEDAFTKAHGRKPWELVNEILAAFDSLRYRVNSPEGSEYFSNYKLRLQHLERPGVEVEFSTLSSGEKILMALVASIYKSASDGQFPDVLLLDEVDASLHPSMMKNMLDVIQDVFLKQGVKVVLVTHSPTTIALAPEESVFVVNPSGSIRIEKKSKSDALSILTQGFATLEEGLRLFDATGKETVTIITEGRNVNFISDVIRHYSIEGVEVLSGIEDYSGKHQLKTLFEFFSRTNHKNKVIFVWDCDVEYKLTPSSNTFPYILPKNSANNISEAGIENMFPACLFDKFTNKTLRSNGDEIHRFDGRKAEFEKFIITRNNPADFEGFKPFVEELRRIKSL